MPVVIEDVVNVSAVSLESVPHAQVCAQLALSMLLVVVAEVIEERAALPLSQPIQVPVTVMLLTVVVPARFVLPVTIRSPAIVVVPPR